MSVVGYPDFVRSHISCPLIRFFVDIFLDSLVDIIHIELNGIRRDNATTINTFKYFSIFNITLPILVSRYQSSQWTRFPFISLISQVIDFDQDHRIPIILKVNTIPALLYEPFDSEKLDLILYQFFLLIGALWSLF
jgi:hypothetical protein